jgi:hypothetical protein
VSRGTESRQGELLVFTWPGSFKRIAVEIDPAGAEGPMGVEVRGVAEGTLPVDQHPVLGGRFLAVP